MRFLICRLSSSLCNTQPTQVSQIVPLSIPILILGNFEALVPVQSKFPFILVNPQFMDPMSIAHSSFQFVFPSYITLLGMKQQEPQQQ